MLVGVALERGRQQGVDLLVGHVESLALLGRQLHGDRLGTSVQEHVPAVRMSLHALMVGEGKLRHDPHATPWAKRARLPRWTHGGWAARPHPASRSRTRQAVATTAAAA